MGSGTLHGKNSRSPVGSMRGIQQFAQPPNAIAQPMAHQDQVLSIKRRQPDLQRAAMRFHVVTRDGENAAS
jgi:hypothetical protein